MSNEIRRRPLRIAFLTVQDPKDRRSWSGTHYYMASALERQCGEVDRLGPLKPPGWRIMDLAQRGLRRATGRGFLFTVSLSKQIGSMAQKKVAQRGYDVIVAPAGASVVAYLRSQSPIIYVSDATLRGMLGYYPEFSNMPDSHVRRADAIETLALSNAAQLVYPSHWAARSAIEQYKVSPSRVHVIPFGANIDAAPEPDVGLRPLSTDKCRLLFVGVEWERKGGAIAMETLLHLERLGVPAELTVVGCRPPDGLYHRNLIVIPFINKNEPKGRARLQELWTKSDFFLLPTRAECYGISLCEASAFGLPILSSDTGGVPEIVVNGVNGYLFPLNAAADQYAQRIQHFWHNREEYGSLRRTSRAEFDTRLNWDAWAERLREVLWFALENNVTSTDGASGILCETSAHTV